MYSSLDRKQIETYYLDMGLKMSNEFDSLAIKIVFGLFGASIAIDQFFFKGAAQLDRMYLIFSWIFGGFVLIINLIGFWVSEAAHARAHKKFVAGQNIKVSKCEFFFFRALKWFSLVGILLSAIFLFVYYYQNVNK